jgi:hypothetical protein
LDLGCQQKSDIERRKNIECWTPTKNRILNVNKKLKVGHRLKIPNKKYRNLNVNKKFKSKIAKFDVGKKVQTNFQEEIVL